MQIEVNYNELRGPLCYEIQTVFTLWCMYAVHLYDMCEVYGVHVS